MSTLSAERVLIVLKRIAASTNGISVRETARTLGYSPAGVERILQALTAQGFAEKDAATQRYVLGSAALDMGLAGLSRLDVRTVSRPHLQELAESTGETALLGLRQGDSATYVDKVISRSEIRLDAPLGCNRPFNCTAAGKTLLAYMPEDELERFSARGVFVKATCNSIVDVAALKVEMAKVQRQGVAADREEFVEGAMCLAAPVRDHDGLVVAAIALAGPVQRVEANEAAFTSQLVSCANAISADLGYRGVGRGFAAGL